MIYVLQRILEMVTGSACLLLLGETGLFSRVQSELVDGHLLLDVMLHLPSSCLVHVGIHPFVLGPSPM